MHNGDRPDPVACGVDRIARRQSLPGRPVSVTEGNGEGKRDRWMNRRVSRDQWTGTIPRARCSPVRFGSAVATG